MGGVCSPREAEQNVVLVHSILGNHQHLSPHIPGTFPYFPALFFSLNLHLLLPVISFLLAVPSPSFLPPNIFHKTTSSFRESLLWSNSLFQDLTLPVFTVLTVQVRKHNTRLTISLKLFFFQFICWECGTSIQSRYIKMCSQPVPAVAAAALSPNTYSQLSSAW